MLFETHSALAPAPFCLRATKIVKNHENIKITQNHERRQKIMKITRIIENHENHEHH